LTGGKGCFYRLEDKIDDAAMDKIVNDVLGFRKGDFKIEVAKFCGTTGEPLVNRSIAHAINRFYEAGRKMVLFTNGALLDKKVNGGTFIDYALKLGKINLSLDAGSEDVFERVKGRREFDHIVSNLRELSRRRNEEKKPLNIVVSYVITRKNYNDVVNAAEVISKSGADEIRYRVDFTDPFGIKTLSSDIIKSLGESSKFARDDFKVVKIYSEPEIMGQNGNNGKIYHSEGRKCFTQNFWGCIGPDAELYACGHRAYIGVRSYGSLLENSLAELWESAKRKDSVCNLPDEKCKFCSPSSLRRNELCSTLKEMGEENAIGFLEEKYYKNASS
jgi:MoaA/NifB/PqqE/SkfB family radical SAM enzyme